MKFPDGSIVQSSIAHGDSKKHPESNFPYLLLGSVVAIHFTDDSSNLSKQVVEYDVQSWDPQFVFRRVPMMTPRSGVSDGQFPILRAEIIDGAVNPMDNTSGDIVVLAFLSGELNQPVILGCYPNTKNGSPIGLNAEGETHTIQHKGSTFQLTDPDLNSSAVIVKPAEGLTVDIGEDPFDSYGVSDTNLKAFFEGSVFTPYNTHSHLGNLGVATGPPLLPTMLMPPPPAVAGVVTTTAGVDGILSTAMATRNMKVTPK